MGRCLKQIRTCGRNPSLQAFQPQTTATALLNSMDRIPMRPLACSLIAVSALAVGTAAGALHAGSGTPMQAVTQTTGDRHDHQVLRIDNQQLRWQHNAQTLVLTSAAAGLLVADASNTLPLQLRKGDRLRSANGQGIASVADLLRALRAAAGTPVTVEVVRAQAPLTLHWAASLYAPLLPPAPPPPPSPPRPAR